MARKHTSLRAIARLNAGSPRRANDRGGVVVEFALVSPLLFFLLAAIIDFSLVFNDYQSLRSGVREGARTGSVVNFGNQNGCILAPMVVEPTTDIRSLMCSTKKYIGNDQNETRVRIMLSDGALTTNTPTSFHPGNALTVCAMTKQESTTGMLSSMFENKTLKTKTAIRIEQMPQNLQQEGYEQPLPGGDWSWCSSPDQVSP